MFRTVYGTENIEFLFSNSIGWSYIREDRGSEIPSFIVYLFFSGEGGGDEREGISLLPIVHS